MIDNSHQPKEYDAVLGNLTSVPADGVVLGGLERVKQMLAVGGVEPRIDALLDAFQYGQEGLDLVIQALEDKSEEVQEAAYWLLQDSTEPRVKLALQAYNPYLFFECLRIIEKYTDEVCRIGHVVLSPERQNLVTYDYDGTIRVWNIQTRQVIHRFAAGETTRIYKAVIIPDDRILGLWNCNDFAEVWELKTGQKIFTTPRYADMFWSAPISMDGHTLVSNGDSNSFQLWDVRTGEGISLIDIPEDSPRRLLIYSDSQILVTKNTNSLILELWDWQTQEIVQTFNPQSSYNPAVAISPNRKLLVSGTGENGTITVWNIHTGRKLSTLTSHSSSITFFTFSSDGQTLVSNSNNDVTVQVWGVP